MPSGIHQRVNDSDVLLFIIMHSSVLCLWKWLSMLLASFVDVDGSGVSIAYRMNRIMHSIEVYGIMLSWGRNTLTHLYRDLYRFI